MNELISNFHFFRPLFLLLLPLLVPLFILLRKRQIQNNLWHKVIDQNLLQALLIEPATATKKNPLAWLCTFIALVSIFALAGPSFEKIPQPVMKNQDALIIVLDLSLSMYSEDEKPSRLVKAKRKLIDIIQARTDGLTALLVYSGDAHTVTPLSDDSATLATMIDALEPSIMPKYGSNALAAFAQAKSLMLNAGLNQAKILWLTDEINSSQLSSIAQEIGDDIQLSIITFGTEAGAPIPLKNGFLKDAQGKTVVARLNYREMQNAIAQTPVQLQHNRLDDKDFTRFANSSNIKNSSISEQAFELFIDRGHALSLLLLPLLLLGFRRGAGLLLLCIMIFPEVAYSQSLLDYFKNADQKAHAEFQKKNYQDAAASFKDPKWQASSFYKNGDYEAALKNYQAFSDGDSLYNQANSLAKLGRLEEASKRYAEALKAAPNNQDAISNKQLVDKLLQQKQEQQEKDDQQSSDEKNSDESSEKKEQNGDKSDDSKPSDQGEESDQQSEPQDNNSSDANQDTENNSADNDSTEEDKKQEDSTTTKDQKDQEPTEDEAQSGEEQQATDDAENTSEANTQTEKPLSPLEQEQKQALEQWLRRIPDEPGNYLRNKFGHQYQKNRRNNNLVDKESEQLW